MRVDTHPSGSSLLCFQNSYLDFARSPTDVVKRTGTIAALRNYTRSFRMDPRLVSIRRISNERGPDGVMEVWETIIPLPEFTRR